MLLLLLGVTSVQAASVRNVRMWLAPDHARLVFDLSGPVEHKIFTLSGPDRLVLDIERSSLATDLGKLGLAKSPIDKIRSAQKGKNLRIVLDLNEKIRPRSFDLKPNDQYGHRLVVDLFRPEQQPVSVPLASSSSLDQKRDIVISIDAGHGGDDPGAIGPGRTREKDVVLAIAKRLDALLDAEPGFKGELTRQGDYYISLRGRTQLARKNNADMFVSIHADAFKNPAARGASVWVLSPRGASSEMGRWLARKENSADLMGGVGSVSLEDKDKVLASVLLDMSMTASRADSRELAKNIHSNIAGFARMHKSHVEQAGFVVLKSPDIPSVLVETGFISNPAEARKLRSSGYQRQMADAIFRGIKAHFHSRPPANSLIAWQQRGGQGQAGLTRQYRVVRGDTLSLIASRHGVSLSMLKKANRLSHDRIRVGQVLTIPAS
ncbi:N-acetylmuramoyl-L-alanine amidase [Marinobacterium arenosum]|uniref:N-acetylmuramoyl-L-alanine amidase n=1 Tax=Marinobacterium arenosum TaxID=2862496 RepID=UPI00210338F7|nr:N-acetylmuramoyl-L-alanine amidase [Marinobacterium arenosum]